MEVRSVSNHRIWTWLFWPLCIAYVALGAQLLPDLVKETEQYKSGKEELAAYLNYKERMLDIDEWLKQEKSWKKKKGKADDLRYTIDQNCSRARDTARKSVLLSAIYLLGGLILAVLSRRRWVFILTLFLISISCLATGLCTPLLEISAYEESLEIPINWEPFGLGFEVKHKQRFQGEMYFYYQSKSIIELIDLLYEAKNYVVAVSIFLFSILFPIAKLTTSAAFLLRGKSSRYAFIRWLAFQSGKWSMADVFVAAVFLAFLAFNNMNPGIQTDSSLMMGFYFFLAYCILSILMSTFIKNNLPDGRHSIS